MRALFCMLMLVAQGCAPATFDELEPPPLDQVLLSIDGRAVELKPGLQALDDRHTDPKFFDPPIQIVMAFETSDGSSWFLNVQDRVGEQALVRSHLPSADGAFLVMKSPVDPSGVMGGVSYYARDGERLEVLSIDDARSRVVIRWPAITLVSECGDEVEISDALIDVHLVTNEIVYPLEGIQTDDPNLTWRDMGNLAQARVNGERFDGFSFFSVEHDQSDRQMMAALHHCDRKQMITWTFDPDEEIGSRALSISDRLLFAEDNPDDGAFLAGKTAYWAHEGTMNVVRNDGPGGRVVVEFPGAIRIFRVYREQDGSTAYDQSQSVTVSDLFIRTRILE